MDIRRLGRDEIKKLVNSKNFPVVYPTLNEEAKRILRPHLEKQKVGMVQTVKNASKSLKEWVEAGLPTVSEQTYNKRLSICKGCPHWEAINTKVVEGVCTKCNCTNAKLWLATEQCPNKPPYWDREI